LLAVPSINGSRPIGRDALLLARESRAGNLVPVVSPDERDEAIRDLSRMREDVLAARLRTHQQMKGSAAASPGMPTTVYRSLP